MSIEWISVDDRLPDDAEWVLISTVTAEGDPITTMAFCERYDDIGDIYWLAHNDSSQGEWPDVKFWMPLPPPEGE